MPNYLTHTPDIIAAALAMILTGKTPAETSKALKVPVGTVKSWCAKIPDALLGIGRENRERESRRELVEALTKYLIAAAVALTAQAELLGDKEYLKQILPDRLAYTHEKFADAVSRVAEIIVSTGEPGDRSGEEGSGEGKEGKTEADSGAGFDIEYKEDKSTTAPAPSRSAEDTGGSEAV